MKFFNVDTLIQGIEAIISKNRCSLSNKKVELLDDKKQRLKEVANSLETTIKQLKTENELLEATIKQLKVCSSLQKKDKPLDWELILELIKPILRFFLSDYE